MDFVLVREDYNFAQPHPALIELKDISLSAI